MSTSLRAACAALAALACAATPASSEEGMWTFDNFPSERMRDELGWAPDQAWLDRVMAGTARLPGCSASNVSRDGLVLTNHHCVIACVTALSSTDADYLDTGFMARTRAEERRCPNMSVQVLAGISDVTPQIDAATTGAVPEAFAATRDAEIARLEGACRAGATHCEVVTLYEGGRYALYRYRRYDDVRLVFAPEHRMAAFGGANDNFTFPRHCLDVSFLRLYQNGAPAFTRNHLSMHFEAPAEDDIVLIAGNPGHTSRLRTAAELAFERDRNLPWQIASLTDLRARVGAFAGQSPDQARNASGTLQTIENAIKGLSGRREALSDPAGFARVVARETDLQTRVRRNRANAREVGDAWGEIERAQTAYRRIFYDYQYLEPRAGEGSFLFAYARDLVRGVQDRGLPNAERLARYSDARLPAIVQGLRAERPIAPAFEEVQLAFWLSKVREHLGAATANRVLGGETPDALGHRLAQSRLADPAYRMQLWEGGADAIAASDDPMIVFVRAWDGEARAVRARFSAEVETPVARAHERIARARFRAFGVAHYPDATFSPRISYGRVRGWTEPNGAAIGAFTRIGGFYEHATGAPPLALSQIWLDARGRLDPDTVLNIASSNDVIGGNSGSPLLDREGRVIGVVFDNNIHALGGEYFYDGALNRTVTASAAAIRAALDEVYGMDGLLAELERD